MKRRIPRKIKKWHGKRGWFAYWMNDGTYYFSRSYEPFYVGPESATWANAPSYEDVTGYRF